MNSIWKFILHDLDGHISLIEEATILTLLFSHFVFGLSGVKTRWNNTLSLTFSVSDLPLLHPDLVEVGQTRNRAACLSGCGSGHWTSATQHITGGYHEVASG